MMKSTSFDGSEPVAGGVARARALRRRNGRVAVPMKRSFPAQWNSFSDPIRAPGATQTLNFALLDLVPPQVSDATLTGFYFHLVTPKGTNAQGSEGYITLVLGGRTIAKNFNLTKDINGYNGYDHVADVGMADLTGKGSIAFTLRHAPSGIMIPSRRALNPDVVQDIALVLFYQGERQDY